MIDLSRCDDFDLGPAQIRPSAREITVNGKTTMIEPKVMQLLVALAAQVDRVVSRDHVVEQCWQGRIVGEDAINRVIGKLRRAASDAAGGAFEIDTVARIGLRLRLAEQALPLPISTQTAHQARRPGRSTVAATVAVLALAILLIVRPWHSEEKPMPVIHTTLLPPAVTDLETRGLSAMFENTPERTAAGVAYLRQATAAAPSSAGTWGSLAMSYVLMLGWVPQAERAGVADLVRDAVAHAHRIDPRESRAAAALVSLVPTFRNQQAKETALRFWMNRAHPDNGPLQYQQVQFLMATGRFHEALGLSNALVRASPLVPWIQAANIDLLAANGQLDDADRVAAGALATWPRDPLIWFTTFDLAAFYGRPERALAMAADRGAWPDQTSRKDILLASDMVKAMSSGNPARATAVVRAYKESAALGQGHTERALRAAAALGRLNDAMRFARQLCERRLPAEPRGTMLPLIGLPSEADPPTAALFLPPVRALQQHPDYAALMQTIGLSDGRDPKTRP